MGSVRLYVHTATQAHIIDIPDRGEPTYSDLDRCFECEHRVRLYRQYRRHHPPSVASGLVNSDTETIFSTHLRSTFWHSGCGKNCPPSVDPADPEIARWLAVGVHTHTEAGRLLAEGIGIEDLIATGLPNAGEWRRQRFTIDDARDWIDHGIVSVHTADRWRSAGFNAETSIEWAHASRIPNWTDAACFAAVIVDPYEAHQWWMAVRGRAAHEAAAMAAAFVKVGVDALSVYLWRDLTKGMPGAVGLASATGGDFAAASRAVQAVGVRGAADAVKAVDGNVDALVEWSEAGVTNVEGLRALTRAGLSPSITRDALAPTELTIIVPCGDSNHRLTVAWNGKRCTWTTHDHDRALEQVSSAFGSGPPACLTILDTAKRRWRAKQAISPTAALRSAASGDDADAWAPSFQSGDGHNSHAPD